MLSVIGYGKTQIILRGDEYTSELCCDVGKMRLTFEDTTQIEMVFDEKTNIWKIEVLNQGPSSQSLYKYQSESEGVIFSSDIFSISSTLQGVRHIK